MSSIPPNPQLNIRPERRVAEVAIFVGVRGRVFRVAGCLRVMIMKWLIWLPCGEDRVLRAGTSLFKSRKSIMIWHSSAIWNPSMKMIRARRVVINDPITNFLKTSTWKETSLMILFCPQIHSSFFPWVPGTYIVFLHKHFLFSSFSEEPPKHRVVPDIPPAVSQARCESIPSLHLKP